MIGYFGLWGGRILAPKVAVLYPANLAATIEKGLSGAKPVRVVK